MNLYAFWWTSVLQSWWFHYKVTVIIVSATHHKIVHYQYAQSCHPAFQPNSICWQKQPYYHYRPRLKRCQLSKALLRARLGSKLKICLNGIKMHIFSEKVVHWRSTTAFSLKKYCIITDTEQIPSTSVMWLNLSRILSSVFTII